MASLLLTARVAYLASMGDLTSSLAVTEKSDTKVPRIKDLVLVWRDSDFSI